MEVLEKKKNIRLYYYLKILRTSLIFSVGLSWNNAQAQIISKGNKVTTTQNNGKHIEPNPNIPLLVKESP